MLLESMIDHEYAQTLRMEIEAPMASSVMGVGHSCCAPSVLTYCKRSGSVAVTNCWHFVAADRDVIGGDGDAWPTFASPRCSRHGESFVPDLKCHLIDLSCGCLPLILRAGLC
jgi:hypothetical protein